MMALSNGLSERDLRCSVLNFVDVNRFTSEALPFRPNCRLLTKYPNCHYASSELHLSVQISLLDLKGCERVPHISFPAPGEIQGAVWDTHVIKLYAQ